jgi:hypothetical protein
MRAPYYYEMYRRVQDDNFELDYVVSQVDVDYDFYQKLIASRVFATDEDRLVCIYTDGNPCFYHMSKEDSVLIILKAKHVDNSINYIDPGHA